VEVVVLQVFVSLLLVAGSVLLFAFTCRQRDFDHVDRLALLPLEDGTPLALPREGGGTETSSGPAVRPGASTQNDRSIQS
jgi:hypothetical protein